MWHEGLLTIICGYKKQAHWNGRGLEVGVIKSKAIHYLQKHKSKIRAATVQDWRLLVTTCATIAEKF